MKAKWRALTLALVPLPGLPAQPPATSVPPTPEPTVTENVHQEMTQLVIADAPKLSPARQTSPSPPAAVGAPGVMLMASVIVKAAPGPVAVPIVVVPVYNTPIAHFLETGTIIHVEPKRISFEANPFGFSLSW
jgi:hypothetical protein